MTAIKHIVFDIGRVLIHWDPELPYKQLIPDAEKRSWFLNTVCNGDWNIEQDRGRSWEDAERLLIEQYPDEEPLIRAFRANWRDMVPYAYQDNVDILNTLLDKGHDVTMLTNFAADTFVEAQDMYPFLASGRGVTVSGRVGLIKPDPAIYALHTKTFELEPSKTLFIDDTQPNIDAARAFGWQAIHLPPGTRLANELDRFVL